MIKPIGKIYFICSVLLMSFPLFKLNSAVLTTGNTPPFNSKADSIQSINNNPRDSVKQKLHAKTIKAYNLIYVDPEKALLLAEEIQQKAEQIDNKAIQQEALYIQYVGQKALHQDSIAYAKLKASLYIEKHLEDSTNELSEKAIRNKYKIVQSEKEITLLKNQKKIQDLKFRKNKMIVSVALPSFLILCIISFILWKQYKRRIRLQVSLTDHHQKIRLLNKELIDINKELKNSEKQLKEVNETKDKFFSVVSQDLKSPLKSLSSFLKGFLGSDSEDNNADLFVKRVNESVTNLSMLINNLLEWSRLQTGSMEYKPEKLNLNTFVAENILLVNPQAENKNINIQTQVPENLDACIDKQMMGFALRLLMSLFIEANNNNGQISLWAASKEAIEDNFIAFKIESHGLGDLKNEILSSWDLNEQYIESSEKNRNRGLGLILCKEFIEKHGGAISIIHEGASEFIVYFTIPAV